MRIIAIIAIAAVCGACSGSGIVKIKDPGPVPATTTTTEIDYSQLGIKAVTNRATTTIALGPGQATLQGTVVGPEGPVDAATVHVERLVGNAVSVVDVATLADGTWSVPTILGGRYRVRAWKAPDLALTKPEILYLQSSETKALNLRVDRYSGAVVAASIAPNPPVIGDAVNLFVRLSERRVDDAGVVRVVPLSGASADLAGSGYQLESVNPITADGNGVAEWRLRCTSPNAALSVTVSGSASFPLEVPACVQGGATNEPAPTSTTRTTRSTTTTRR